MATKEQIKRDEKLIEHYKQTLNCVQTGLVFGVSSERVRQITNTHGVFRKDLRKANAHRILDSKKDSLGVSETLSISEAHQIRKHLGISYHKVKMQNISDIVLECYAEGMIRADIARYLNIHYKTVSKYLKLDKQKPGCLRGESTKKRDKELYLYWKISNISIQQVADKFDMTYVNVYYCIKRYLYNNIHSKGKVK